MLGGLQTLDSYRVGIESGMLFRVLYKFVMGVIQLTVCCLVVISSPSQYPVATERNEKQKSTLVGITAGAFVPKSS